MVGEMSGDKVGKATLTLIEYDTDADVTYRSSIHVTVVPMDKQLDWVRDRSANSAALEDWVRRTGNAFQVGTQYSMKTICTLDGVAQKVVYSSNRPSVATVDQNGMVTMVGAGTACITMRCEGTDQAMADYLIVYSEKVGDQIAGGFEPEDKGRRVNMYKSADTGSAVLKTLGYGDELRSFYIFSRGTTWCRVSFEGVTGYILTSDIHFYDNNGLEPTPPATPPGTEPATQPPVSGTGRRMVVATGNTGKLNLREKPDKGSAKLGQYKNGEIVTAYEQTGEWTHVVTGSKTGYMMTRFLKTADDTAPTTGGTPEKPTGDVVELVVRTANRGKLNLRAEPSSGAKALGRYKYGTPMSAILVSADWAFVTVEGAQGYMQRKHLAPAEDKPQETTPGTEPGTEPDVSTATVKNKYDKYVNLREKADRSSDALMQVPVDTQVIILERGKTWSRIRVGITEGYMMTKFLK